MGAADVVKAVHGDWVQVLVDGEPSVHKLLLKGRSPEEIDLTRVAEFVGVEQSRISLDDQPFDREQRAPARAQQCRDGRGQVRATPRDMRTGQLAVCDTSGSSDPGERASVSQQSQFTTARAVPARPARVSITDAYSDMSDVAACVDREGGP